VQIYAQNRAKHLPLGSFSGNVSFVLKSGSLVNLRINHVQSRTNRLQFVPSDVHDLLVKANTTQRWKTATNYLDSHSKYCSTTHAHFGYLHFRSWSIISAAQRSVLVRRSRASTTNWTLLRIAAWRKKLQLLHTSFRSRRPSTTTISYSRQYLTVPCYRLAFLVTNQALWDSLLDRLHDPTLTSDSFRKQLKQTYLSY